MSSDEKIYFYSYDGTTLINQATQTFTNNNLNDPAYWEVILFSHNMSTNKIYLHVVDRYSAGFERSTSANVSNQNYPNNFNEIRIGYSDSKSFFGGMAGFYITNEYINFADEATRLKYVSQLGYLNDLTEAIANEEVPEPIVYLKFRDGSNLGANDGTLGDFTNTGVTISADQTAGN